MATQPRAVEARVLVAISLGLIILWLTSAYLEGGWTLTWQKVIEGTPLAIAGVFVVWLAERIIKWVRSRQRR